MKVGMTGTRRGLTAAQFDALRQYLPWLKITEFHHGDCIGADAEVATLLEMEYPLTRIVSRPCTIEKARAYTPADETHDPIAPLDRNRLIVDHTDLLLAFPGMMREQQRSGTWFTIRYARRQGCPLAIFWPDGSVTDK